MRVFTFLNNGTPVSEERKDGFVFVNLESCVCPDNASAINVYVSNYRFIHSDTNPEAYYKGYDCEDSIEYLVIPEAEYEAINFDIKGDVAKLLKGNGARRPGYQIRGKKLTEKQAFDVLSNSDEVFTTYVGDTLFECNMKNSDTPEDVTYVQSAIDRDRILRAPYRQIGNKFFQRPNFVWYSGFVTPYGDVGCNWWMYKYPQYFEIFIDTWAFAARFPFMEFVVAITYWDERCSEWWDSLDSDKIDAMLDTRPMLERDLQCCLYAHDGIVEVLSDLKKYDELSSQYDDQRIFYTEEYYSKEKGINIFSEEYVRRMMEVHNLQQNKDFVQYLMEGFNCRYV